MEKKKISTTTKKIPNLCLYQCKKYSAENNKPETAADVCDKVIIGVPIDFIRKASKGEVSFFPHLLNILGKRR